MAQTPAPPFTLTWAARRATDFGRLDAVAEKHGAKFQGGWVDMPGHAFFVLADVPNAHAINDVMIETEMFHWNTVDVHPVNTKRNPCPMRPGGRREGQ